MKLEFITENDEEYVLVSNKNQLDEIITRIVEKNRFAFQFKFPEREHFIALLKELNIAYDSFSAKHFHYDPIQKLHISESEFGHVWISTVGLVANKKATTNRSVNSCLNQYLVISLLCSQAIEIVQDEKVYDIDSYNFGHLSELSPAIYHNLVFYIEVFCKAYLSLTNTPSPRSHKLLSIYQKTVEVMTVNNHDNSLFQILVLEPLYKFVEHLGTIPGDFKEQFIKYDDNPQDDTVIVFDWAELNSMTHLLELSVDFINDYFHRGAKTHYLESNVYQRMLDKADTDGKRKRIQELYQHLASKSK